MENEKKTKKDNSRIKEMAMLIGNAKIEENGNIKSKKGKSKLDIKKGIKEIKIFKKIESEKEYLSRVDEKIQKIKEDLEEQLSDQDKYGGHFDHEIENYLFFVRLQEAYKRDIQVNGFRYVATNGNGIDVDKPNDSCERLLKTEQQGLAILNSLELKTPAVGGDEADNDLY